MAPANDSIFVKTMSIGFGDGNNGKQGEGEALADLWRTCVRSLIHDIPRQLRRHGGRAARCRPLVSNPVCKVAGQPGATAKPH